MGMSSKDESAHDRDHFFWTEKDYDYGIYQPQHGDEWNPGNKPRIGCIQ